MKKVNKICFFLISAFLKICTKRKLLFNKWCKLNIISVRDALFKRVNKICFINNDFGAQEPNAFYQGNLNNHTILTNDAIIILRSVLKYGATNSMLHLQK